MLKRSLNWAWLSLAALAVLLAVLVTLLRFGTPWLASVQQQWLDQQFSAHDFRLEVGQLGLSWRDYGPVLVLNNVSVQPADAPTITLRRALVDVQLWQSLRQWRPVLNELTLEGLRLPIRLDAASDKAPLQFDWRGLRHFVLAGVERFSLQDAQLLISDADKELFALHLPDWHWQNGAELHQGQGQLAFSADAKQPLQVRSRFTGPIDRLDGQLYLHAADVDASSMLARIRPEDPAVSARVNLELWLEWQQGQLSAGVLELGENRLGWGEQHQVEVKGGRIQWQPTADGWQLASNQVDISVDDEAWPSWHLQLDRQHDQLLGYLDRLTFTDLALLAQWGENFWPTVARQLAGIRPQGQLTNLYYAANRDGGDWRWQGELAKVSTRAFDWVPQTQGINGHFVLASDRGELSVRQAVAADWVFDQAFRGPWPLQQLTAELEWQKQGQDWLLWSRQLGVSTQDLTLEGWFSLFLPADSSPLLSASARVDVLRAGQAFRYFPEPLMGSGLVNYLQGAIVAGQAKGAEVFWYGRLNGFPYHNDNGIFQARVPLRQTEFRFDPRWQPLTDLSLDLLFQNDGLYMQGSAGRLGAVNAKAIDARIVPLNDSAKLELSAHIEGDGGAVSSYLQDSPLASSVGKTLEQVQVSGPLNAELALSIPLRGGQVGVQGWVDFARNGVRIKPLDLPLTEVSGRLLFDEQQTEFTDLKASWHGQPLQLAYRGQHTDAGYEVELDMAGQWQPEKLQKTYPPLHYLTGSTDWRGQLQLSLPEQGALQYRFSASSALRGLHSRFPAPFSKNAAQAHASQLTLKGDLTQASVELNLGEQIRGQAQLAFAPAGPSVQQLWLSAGAGVNAAEPRAPLDIALRVPELALDDWLALLSELASAPGLVAADPAQTAAPTAASGVRWPERYRVTAQASRAHLWQQPLHQLSLTLKPESAGRARLDIQAEQAAGQLVLGGDQPLQAHFTRLWLGQAQPQADASQEAATVPAGLARITVTPRQVPALEFHCDDCRWQQVALGKVAFALQPQAQENGVQLSRLTLDGPLLQAKAKGQWLQQNSVNISRLEWQGSTPSLQRLWQAFGKESPFSKTSAQLDGSLRWLAEPWQPDLASMNGQLAVDTGAGVLREVSDKGVGLLSVLSLESVLRRLRLDFRDVYAQGLYFDGIRARGELQGGVLHNEDLLLKGAAGYLRGQGTLDFTTEQIDYNLELTPNLTGNLPVLAAFAVTPVAGLYVLALSKVLGPVVDVFTRIRYQVSGAIAEPKVVELGRDQQRISVPELP